MKHFLFKKHLSLPFTFRRKRREVNAGLIITVVIAAAVTWFLTEYVVFQLNEMDNDRVSLSWLTSARPQAAAQTPSPCATAYTTYYLKSGDIPPSIVTKLGLAGAQANKYLRAGYLDVTLYDGVGTYRVDKSGTADSTNGIIKALEDAL